MRMTILLFHPDYGKSKANRALAEGAATVRGVDIVEMGSLYPDGDIDVDAEVARLLSTRRLVLQFPVLWYATPPLLKTWQDTVLTRMYYIHAEEEGEKLRDLPVLVAATVGNEPEAYTSEGVNLFSLDELLRPLQATAHRCFWEWREPFLVYRASKLSDEERVQAGRRYAERLETFS